MLFRAVVVDVIYDPTDTSKHGRIMSKFEVTADQIAKCPPNSCIVRYYGGGVTPSQQCKIAFPMLSSHISMPLKPGECVWVFSPGDEPLPNESYWLCRIVGNKSTEDANYTHLPRTPQGQDSGAEEENAPDVVQPTSTRADMIDSGKEELVYAQEPGEPVTLVPAFENISDGKPFLATDKKETQAAKAQKAQGGEGNNPFDVIVENAGAYANFSPEAIPTFYKRPGDLVLQGSNNALISLGQDRGIVATTPTSDIDTMLSASASAIPRDVPCGTIDIVAGRSRYLPAAGYNQDGESPPAPERTNFQKGINSRKYQERFKEPRGVFNDLEGAPDFAVDASRVYVSMNTDGDTNFGLTNEFSRMPAGVVTGSIQPVSSSAYIIAKSDEIRLIARKQLEDEYYPSAGNPEINGSIKIIKEGKPNEDLAAVVLQPDGTIQISGSRIFLGRHPDDDGLEESTSGPDDAIQAQPYVRYQQLEDLLNAILDNIDAFCDTLNTHVTPGYGNPSPQILDAAATLKSDVASRREEIVTLKSTRIFGE